MRLAVLVAVATVALALSGCLELKQHLEILPGNRGRFTVSMSLPMDLYESFLKPGNGEAAAARQASGFFDLEAGASRYRKADGFELSRYRVYERDGRKTVQIEGSITDLDKALASGLLGPLERREVEPGRWRLAMRWPQQAADASADDGQRVAQLRGLKLEFQVTVPGEVLSSDAQQREENNVKWVFDVAKDPAFLSELPAFYVEYRLR